ncbi:MAG: S41 family peptidase [Angelakisella sp.]
MNKKISLGAAIAYMAIVAAITFSLTTIAAIDNFNSKMTSFNERETTYDKLAEIDRFVRDNFYGIIDNETVLTGSAAGYIAGLGDPSSRYMTAKEYEEYTKVESGKYVGIGVVTELSEDGYIRLKTVYPESPAAVVGLVPGDIIISIDETPAKAENYAQLAGSLQGEAGTQVSLVKRDKNEDKPLTLTRRDVDIPTVETKTFETVGYLRFTTISPATPAQMDKAIKALLAGGSTSLIVDLRDIKSTSMEYISDMLDILLPEGDTVFTKYKDGTTKAIASSDKTAVALPITVLANENTSGAPEMFVQAVREQDNCKFVGTATAGSGSLQKAFKLSDGSALMITTAVYASAKGQTYNKTGVVPDFDVKLTAATPEEYLAMLGHPDSDPQLRKALEISAATVNAEATSSVQASSESATTAK